MSCKTLKVLLMATGLLWVFAADAAAADGSNGWAIYGGIFDTRGDDRPGVDDRPFELGIEYRWREIERFELPSRLQLKPTAGLAGTEDGNVWIYGGLRLDVQLGERWVMTPQFSVALYEDGDGKDLGGVVEFRSGFELAYRFEKGQRLGLLFYHLSNAGLYDSNPGSNSLVLTWGFGR
ncbi:MAG: acyloxyacyl hydrolase [Acidobacteriota bacterium]